MARGSGSDTAISEHDMALTLEGYYRNLAAVAERDKIREDRIAQAAEAFVSTIFVVDPQQLELRKTVNERGDCRNAPSGVFHPPFFENPSNRIERLRIAFTYCEYCPVREDCFELGVKNNEIGVWGGYDFRLSSKGRSQEPISIAKLLTDLPG